MASSLQRGESEHRAPWAWRLALRRCAASVLPCAGNGVGNSSSTERSRVADNALVSLLMSCSLSSPGCAISSAWPLSHKSTAAGKGSIWHMQCNMSRTAEWTALTEIASQEDSNTLAPKASPP